MKLVRSFAVSFGIALMVTISACSSSSSDSSSSGSCDEAKTVADSCNAKPQDGGTSISITFDSAACAQSDQGKKAAQCIVDNKSNCDCILKCSLTGSCS